jgi:hypothetical protein
MKHTHVSSSDEREKIPFNIMVVCDMPYLPGLLHTHMVADDDALITPASVY